MSIMPGIHLKSIPEDVFEKILDKQLEETKRKKRKVNMSQAVIMLLKDTIENNKNKSK